MRHGEPLGPDTERYLAEAEAALGELPPHARAEVLAELRDHIARWGEEQGRAPEDLTYAEVEAELGPPEALGTWAVEGGGPTSGPLVPALPPPGRRVAGLVRWSWVAAAAAVPLAAVVSVLVYASAGHLPFHVAGTGSAVHAAGPSRPSDGRAFSSSAAAAQSATVGTSTTDRAVSAAQALEIHRTSTELAQWTLQERSVAAQLASLAAQQQAASQGAQALEDRRVQLQTEMAQVSAQRQAMARVLADQGARTLCGQPAPVADPSGTAVPVVVQVHSGTMCIWTAPQLNH